MARYPASRAAFAYPAKLETDEDGRVVVTLPDFGWGATDGADRDEALTEASDLLRELLATTMIEGAEIPAPSPARGRPMVAAPAVIAAKAALYIELRTSGMTKVALAKHMGVHESDVRRLLNPEHASKIGRIEDALAVFGKRLVVGVA